MSESQEQSDLSARIEEARAELKAATEKLQNAARGIFTRIEESATGLFDDLVKAGESFKKERSKDQKKTAKAKKADANPVESLANKAFGALGLPTSDDVQSLNKKLDSLSRKLRKLEKATAA